MSSYTPQPNAVGEAIRSDPNVPSFTAVLDALADEQRRKTIQYLADQERGVAVDELVAAVVTDGRKTGPPADGTGQDTMRFHHVHLPKLDATGLIEHDHDEELVRLTETGRTVKEHFDGQIPF